MPVDRDHIDPALGKMQGGRQSEVSRPDHQHVGLEIAVGRRRVGCRCGRFLPKIGVTALHRDRLNRSVA
jgi:hypothetical protein